MRKSRVIDIPLPELVSKDPPNKSIFRVDDLLEPANLLEADYLTTTYSENL